MERSRSRSRLLVFLFAMLAALTMAVAVHPVTSEAKTVTCKSVKLTGKTKKTKAKKVRKGTTVVRFKNDSKEHYIVFTATKKKKYKFTFYNLHAVDSNPDIGYGSVYPYYSYRGRLRPYTYKKTFALLPICTPYCFDESETNYSSSGWFKIKLKKGEKVYFDLSASVYPSTWATINVKIK